MNNIKVILTRICIFLFAIWFASLDSNPVVYLITKIGLSPSPLERIFNVKGLFSGMTEGMHRLANGDVAGAVSANFLTPLIAIIFAICIFSGYRPRVKSKAQEMGLLGSIIFLSVLVNYTNPISKNEIRIDNNFARQFCSRYFILFCRI